MVCIYCGGPTQVTNSRHQKQANQIWRRRKCATCGALFTTTEAADLSRSIMLTDKNGQPAGYLLREVLFAGIYEACKHRNDPAGDAAALTQTVLNKLIGGENRSAAVAKHELAQLAHATLANFDKTAAAVYAAYHLK